MKNVYSTNYSAEVRAAIYCRLSKDDDLIGESECLVKVESS